MPCSSVLDHALIELNMFDLLNEWRGQIHLLLHVLVPLMVALIFFRHGGGRSGGHSEKCNSNKRVSEADETRQKISKVRSLHVVNEQPKKFFNAVSSTQVAFTIMLLTMLVDIDHLLATPIYQADRCSIGFHPLHTEWPILIYAVLCAFPKTRLIGLGLVIHMLLDAGDCMWMRGTWAIDVF